MKLRTYNKEKEYWLNTFDGEHTLSRIPFSQSEVLSKRRYAEYTFQLTERQAEQLERLCSGSDVKRFLVLKAAMLLLLKSYCQSNDVTLGVPIYRQPSNQNLINTFLPLRFRLEEQDTVMELLTKAGRLLFQASEHQNFQMEALLYHLGMQMGEEDTFPLFDTMVLLENIHDPAYVASLAVNLKFLFVKHDGGVRGTVVFNEWVYEEKYIGLIVANYLHILAALLNNPQARLKEIPLLSGAESALVLEGVNNTGFPVEEGLDVCARFTRAAHQYCDQVAVVFRDHQLTYGELLGRANQVAAELIRMGVRKNQIVPLLMDRSLEMIIGIFGIIKSGGAYLPIDPDLPERRKKYIIADCCAGVVVGKQAFIPDGLECPVLDLSGLEHLPEAETDVNVPMEGDDLLYVLYTSGTTGSPKGVLVQHKNTANLISWFKRTYRIGPRHRLLLFSEYTFDPSTEDIFGALLHGSQLVVPDRETILDQAQFRIYLEKNRVNTINVVPSILESIAAMEKIECLELLISGGDLLRDSLKNQILDLGYELHNAYGPTETTVDVLHHPCSQDKVVLGRPVGNTRCYILGPDLQLLPVGAVGEICIGGSGTSRGYLNNVALTREKFVANPHRPHEIIYRTGDYGRWLPSGDVEFAGRKDEQIKIRGHRVEIKEIENNIARIKGIKAVVVLPRKSGRSLELCCYFISNAGVTKYDIIRFLYERLPKYMIPSFIKRVEAFPELPNGKIDKLAFQQPQYLSEDENKIIAPPSNELEEMLVNIWKKILGSDQVGIYDNFFEAGGDSLKIVQLQNELKQQLDNNVPVVALFKYPTISALAAHLNARAAPDDAGQKEDRTRRLTEAKNRLRLKQQ